MVVVVVVVVVVGLVAPDVGRVVLIGGKVVVGCSTSMQLLGRATRPHSRPTRSMTPAPPTRAAISTGFVTSKAVFFIAIIFAASTLFY